MFSVIHAVTWRWFQLILPLKRYSTQLCAPRQYSRKTLYPRSNEWEDKQFWLQHRIWSKRSLDVSLQESFESQRSQFRDFSVIHLKLCYHVLKCVWVKDAEYSEHHLAFTLDSCQATCYLHMHRCVCFLCIKCLLAFCEALTFSQNSEYQTVVGAQG